jgi:hypothetical protein
MFEEIKQFIRRKRVHSYALKKRVALGDLPYHERIENKLYNEKIRELDKLTQQLCLKKDLTNCLER